MRATVRDVVVNYRNKWLVDMYNPTKLFRPGMPVLDIGVHVGTFTLAASRLVGSTGTVVTVEPVPQNYQCLVRTVEANHLANVISKQCAVGASVGELDLSLSE
jgi:tRNA A58 N-methylase Trm61